MKKKTTLVSQPDKTETTRPEFVGRVAVTHKMYRDHSHCDHSHGRVNKYPFGSMHGPFSF